MNSIEDKILWHRPVHPLVLGVGGSSRAGKTSFSTFLKENLPFTTRIICLDDCVLPPEKIPHIRNHINWEIPESIDWDSFDKNWRETQQYVQVVIIEGLFVLNVPEIFNKLHVGIYLDIPRRSFISKKKKDLRWGAEPLWYIYYIWKAHRSNAFALHRRWGEYPIMLRFPGNNIFWAFPELVSLISRLL